MFLKDFLKLFFKKVWKSLTVTLTMLSSKFYVITLICLISFDVFIFLDLIYTLIFLASFPTSSNAVLILIEVFTSFRKCM